MRSVIVHDRTMYITQRFHDPQSHVELLKRGVNWQPQESNQRFDHCFLNRHNAARKCRHFTHIIIELLLEIDFCSGRSHGCSCQYGEQRELHGRLDSTVNQRMGEFSRWRCWLLLSCPSASPAMPASAAQIFLFVFLSSSTVLGIWIKTLNLEVLLVCTAKQRQERSLYQQITNNTFFVKSQYLGGNAGRPTEFFHR